MDMNYEEAQAYIVKRTKKEIWVTDYDAACELSQHRLDETDQKRGTITGPFYFKGYGKVYIVNL